MGLLPFRPEHSGEDRPGEVPEIEGGATETERAREAEPRPVADLSMAEPETDWRTPFPVRRPGGRHRSARERRLRGSSPCRRTSRHRGGGFAARGGPRRIHLLTSCRFTQTWHDAHPGEGGQQEASADVGARRRSATGSGAASRCGIGGRHGAEREGPRTGVRRHAERARPRIGRPTVAEAPAPPGRGPRRARCRGPGRASARRAGVRSGMRDHPATRRGTGRHQRHRQRKRLHPGSGARVLGLGRLLPGGGRWRGAQRSRGRNVPDDVHGSIRRDSARTSCTPAGLCTARARRPPGVTQTPPSPSRARR